MTGPGAEGRAVCRQRGSGGAAATAGLPPPSPARAHQQLARRHGHVRFILQLLGALALEAVARDAREGGDGASAVVRHHLDVLVEVQRLWGDFCEAGAIPHLRCVGAHCGKLSQAHALAVRTAIDHDRATRSDHMTQSRPAECPSHSGHSAASQRSQRTRRCRSGSPYVHAQARPPSSGLAVQ